jgi:1-deoxy-D-xylulose-5-phosphate reductoisomerase
MKSIGILGSTGSIGVQTLEVIDTFPGEYDIKYLTAKQNVQLLAEQALMYNPDIVCIVQEEFRDELEVLLKNTDINITAGRNALLELSGRNDVELVMNGLVGAAGMEPTIEAVKSGVDVALSNKESMVMAGGIINDLLKTNSCNLFPVDSEHSAIWQCLKGEKYSEIKRLILTGSGGPFRNKPKDDFDKITLEQALQHPNWNMGNKITIDSATMMNKGLEVIEAYWLFNITSSQIDIVVHPESIIHSMVEFVDGSIKAQLGVPDMKIPIQYSLTYPHHSPANWENLDFVKMGTLHFEKPDLDKFPCIRLAYEALKKGGSSPIVLNVANDNVVAAFLKGLIPFTQIPSLIEDAISQHDWVSNPNLEAISELSGWTSQFIQEQITTYA